MSSDDHKTRKNELDYVLRSGLAGGVAGCVAKTVIAPLDRVKILFQASNPDFVKYAGSWSGAFRAGTHIYKEHGARGLLQGHSATLIRVFPYAAVKFMAYDHIRHLLMPRKESETNVRRFAAGAASGIVAVFLTYPLEVIRVRMAYQTRSTDADARPSFKRAFKQIYAERASAPAGSARRLDPKNILDRFPLLKFYRGFTVTVGGMIPYAGTSFLAWDFLRAHMLPPQGKASGTTPVADLAIGAVSGAIAQTVSYPFEVVRRRMQVGGITQPDRWLGWNETAQTIWRARGWQGFYVGLSIGYLKVVPMTAVSFAVWQAGKRLLGI
ncbi:mitochondrial carrier domain-containing protein [Schizophyllum amplum]|uniref:Mitochondrial carrier domain-containing protein n=1 Tax=Schizophyllum amplum TaxID=97359 RepID=A0A550CWR3_9AGAR|nr:mitochondrial carrier domain-containing protein [Auriculariopsis ampla]